MSEERPTFPDLTQHTALAGRTGSGKTWGSIDMLSRRVQPTKVSKGRPFPWVIIDNKRDKALAMIPHEKLSPRAKFLPDSGVHIVRPKLDGSDKADVEDLLDRLFERKVCGCLMDEGHLHGKSPALRKWLIAGRARYCPVMYTSQRATDIDPFIWSQATFFRCFALHGPNDHRRFYENFGFRYYDPDPYHSFYFDGEQGKTHLLSPASPIDESLARFNATLLKRFNHI